MNKILIVKPDSINDNDKALLTENGIIVIEHNDPDSVRIVTMLDGIVDGNDILFAALKAINNGGFSIQSEFSKTLCSKLIENETSHKS